MGQRNSSSSFLKKLRNSSSDTLPSRFSSNVANQACISPSIIDWGACTFLFLAYYSSSSYMTSPFLSKSKRWNCRVNISIVSLRCSLVSLSRCSWAFGFTGPSLSRSDAPFYSCASWVTGFSTSWLSAAASLICSLLDFFTVTLGEGSSYVASYASSPVLSSLCGSATLFSIFGSFLFSFGSAVWFFCAPYG